MLRKNLTSIGERYWSNRWFRVVVIAVLLLGAYFYFGQPLSGRCEVNAAGARPIVTSTIGVQMLWSAALSIDPLVDNTVLVGTPDSLIVGQSCHKLLDALAQISAFDWKTGQGHWSTVVSPGLENIAIDPARNRIYVSGQQYIEALSTLDGKSIWTNSSLDFLRRSHPLQVLPDDRLVVYLPVGIRFANPVDGNLQDSWLPDSTFLFDGTTYYAYCPDEQNGGWCIQAHLIKTNQLIWTMDFFNEPSKKLPSPISETRMGPFTTENLLIYRDPGIQLRLNVVNKNTGKFLWGINDDQDHAIVSNAVVSQGILFALDQQARLLLLDAQTGTQLGAVEFQQPYRREGDSLYQPGAIGGSLVEVQGNLVAVYFADTGTLSVLNLTLPPVEF